MRRGLVAYPSPDRRTADRPCPGQGPRRPPGDRRRQPGPPPRRRGTESVRVLEELRTSRHGVERLLAAYDGSPLSADFLDTVISFLFLDPAIAVTRLGVAEEEGPGGQLSEGVERFVEEGAARARELGRVVACRVPRGDPGREIVRAAVEGKFDAIFMSLRGEYRRRGPRPGRRVAPGRLAGPRLGSTRTAVSTRAVADHMPESRRPPLSDRGLGREHPRRV